ncbi:calcium load-activated calcium channel-like [Juglans microcarpa x Juglans regia]|uniref:calcium load-activated calcium channel-like n=1 Tax=Juglans microcarpa x Juglans regia TaxID=2249226 RepID=UPI001B7EECA1|nr:calcium load-activated calcium channel-like [Juglans microcarpa x Juglans regia]
MPVPKTTLKKPLSRPFVSTKQPPIPKASPQIFSSFKYSDSLIVVAISFCTAIVCEAISWLIIHHINSYKSMSSIDKAAKKLETMKTESSTNIAKKSKTKKMGRVETSLKESSRDLSLFKFKSGTIVALVLFVVFGLLNSLFLGFSSPRGVSSGLFPMPDPKTN